MTVLQTAAGDTIVVTSPPLYAIVSLATLNPRRIEPVAPLASSESSREN